tara:strand:- start:77 stop:385 length:309 start_codon:yes stop_codon:yes gene_type:complete
MNLDITTTRGYAIKTLCPNAKWSMDSNNVITWIEMNGDAVPSDSAIDAKVAEFKTAYDNKKYQRDRAAEYPSVVDQLDDIYHNGIDGWKTTIKKTKDKYPKS